MTSGTSSVGSAAGFDDFEDFINPSSDEALQKRVQGFSELGSKLQELIRGLAKTTEGLTALEVIEGIDFSDLNRPTQTNIINFLSEKSGAFGVPDLKAGVAFYIERLPTTGVGVEGAAAPAPAACGTGIESAESLSVRVTKPKECQLTLYQPSFATIMFANLARAAEARENRIRQRAEEAAMVASEAAQRTAFQAAQLQLVANSGSTNRPIQELFSTYLGMLRTLTPRELFRILSARVIHIVLNGHPLALQIPEHVAQTVMNRLQYSPTITRGLALVPQNQTESRRVWEAIESGYEADIEDGQPAYFTDASPERLQRNVQNLLVIHSDAVNEGRRALSERTRDEVAAARAQQAHQAQLEAVAQKKAEAKLRASQIQTGGEGSGAFIALLRDLGVSPAFFEGQTVRQLCVVAVVHISQRLLSIQSDSKRGIAFRLVADIMEEINKPALNWNMNKNKLLQRLSNVIRSMSSGHKRAKCKNVFHAVFELLSHQSTPYIVIKDALITSFDAVSEADKGQFTLDRATAFFTWVCKIVPGVIQNLPASDMTSVKLIVRDWPIGLARIKAEHNLELALQMAASTTGVCAQIIKSSSSSRKDVEMIRRLVPYAAKVVLDLHEQKGDLPKPCVLPAVYTMPPKTKISDLSMIGVRGEPSERAELASIKVPLERAVELRAPHLVRASATSRFDQGFRFQFSQLISCVELLKRMRSFSSENSRGSSVALCLTTSSMVHQAFYALLTKAGIAIPESRSLVDLAKALGIWTSINGDQRIALREFNNLEEYLGTPYSTSLAFKELGATSEPQMLTDMNGLIRNVDAIVDLCLVQHGVDSIDMAKMLEGPSSVQAAGVASEPREGLDFMIDISPTKLALLDYIRHQASTPAESAVVRDLLLNMESLASMVHRLKLDSAFTYLPAFVKAIQHALRNSLLLSHRMVAMSHNKGLELGDTTFSDLTNGVHHKPYLGDKWEELMKFVDVDGSQLEMPLTAKRSSPLGVLLPMVASMAATNEYNMRCGAPCSRAGINGVSQEYVESLVDKMLIAVEYGTSIVDRNIEIARV